MQAETLIPDLSRNLFLYQRNVLPIYCTAIGVSSKTCLVNCASVEDAPDGIEGGGSQTGSEESDSGTAQWIGDQLQQN